MKLYMICCAAIAILLSGCEQSADDIQNQAQERDLLQGVRAVGMPSITRFAEKRELKEIYELRDKEIPTYTYIVDMNGKPHKLCNSVGFGIPYATEYTNPQHLYSSTTAVLPQADPNDLYSPSSADGTWVLCLNKETNKAVPLYVEPRVIVSPFELK